MDASQPKLGNWILESELERAGGFGHHYYASNVRHETHDMEKRGWDKKEILETERHEW